MGKSTTLVTLLHSTFAGGDNLSKLVDSYWVIIIRLRENLEAIEDIGSGDINIPKFLKFKAELFPKFVKVGFKFRKVKKAYITSI